jgi:hypothetical protein
MKKKIFQQFLRFQAHFLSFLENRIFFKNQAFLHAAPMIFVILSSKATKKLTPLQFIAGGTLLRIFIFHLQYSSSYDYLFIT